MGFGLGWTPDILLPLFREGYPIGMGNSYRHNPFRRPVAYPYSIPVDIYSDAVLW